MVKKKLSAAESKQREITAKTIKSVLRTRGINQTQMAEEIGCGRKSVERYSNCERSMPSATRRKFMEAYGMDPDLPFDQQRHAAEKIALEDAQRSTADKRSSTNYWMARLKALKVIGPKVSPNNPKAIMCLSCGENEHIDSNRCRCGAPLAKQLRNQYSDWEAIKKPAIIEVIKTTDRRSWQALIFSALPFIMLVSLSLMRRTQATMFANFPGLWFLVMLSLVGSLSYYMALERKKKHLYIRLKALSFDDFLQSDYFNTLRRPAAESDEAAQP